MRRYESVADNLLAVLSGLKIASINFFQFTGKAPIDGGRPVIISIALARAVKTTATRDKGLDDHALLVPLWSESDWPKQ